MPWYGMVPVPRVFVNEWTPVSKGIERIDRPPHVLEFNLTVV